MHVKPEKKGGEQASTEDEEQIYRFYSFHERDFTFKYIRRLWTNVSPFAGEDDSSEPSETEDTAPASAYIAA